MEIFLTGHDYRYAAEQMLLSLYPEERPLYPEKPSGADAVRLSLRRGRRYAVCVCRLSRGGRRSRGEARVALAALAAPLAEDRLLQRIVKLAFYRAALADGRETPVWGSLTGVRPGKLFASLLRSGATEAQAIREFRETFGVSAERTELCREAVRASETARASLGPGDVCLYVGIPFCPTRCAYCSFVSVDVAGSFALLPDYLTALERELEAVAAAAAEAGARVVSVYVGGGTPTTLSAPQLERLCGRIRALFDLAGCREFTVEAGRPDTVTAEKLAALRRAGVTRVSVNPQTMSDAVLEAIGRRHSAADVVRAVELTRAQGPFELNMDLIAGLPGDTPALFERTVRAVLAFAPENITVHTLALKKGSRFLTEGASLPDGAAVGAMLESARALLRGAGYAPYYLYRQKFMSGSFENVGWTTPGHANLYNMCIMEELCSVLSAGAGGSTKLVTPGGAVKRLSAPKYPREYIRRIDETCAGRAVIADFLTGLRPPIISPKGGN